MLQDRRGLPVVAASAKAVAAFDNAVEGYIVYQADLPRQMEALLAAAPDLGLAQCPRGYLAPLACRRSTLPTARAGGTNRTGRETVLHQQEASSSNYRSVEFPSEGATLRGRLYLPRMEGALARQPLLVMAHGFTSTVGMTTDRYAEVFAAAGIAVLLYDHRNFGASGGEPRREVNPWIQARGYRDAVRFAKTLPEVDGRRVALWGLSNSGMQVVVLGALLDGEVAAVTAVVPSCGEELPPSDPDGRLFAALRETFERGDVAGTPETSAGPMPVVSFDPIRYSSHLAPPTAFRWFMEYGGRPGVGWVNDATRVVPETPAPFSPGIAAPHVQVPVQVIYAPDDEMGRANPAVTRLACDALGGPKEIVELEQGCGHFGELWHPSPWFDRVSALQADFLARHLAASH